MADKESSPECFICTESEPTHRSACLCTDRYMHTDCFVKMLKAQKGEPKCGVRHATEQNVRAAFSCNSPFLYTFHMTPGMLQQLVDQLDDVQPSSVIGHFGRQRDTGVWVAHNDVALRRDDHGGVYTESHAAVGVAMLMSAIQRPIYTPSPDFATASYSTSGPSLPPTPRRRSARR